MFAQTKAFKYSKLKAKYSLNIVQELRGVDVVKYFGVGQIQPRSKNRSQVKVKTHRPYISDQDDDEDW